MRKSLVLFVALGIACISTIAEARYKEVDAIIFNPVTDGGKYVTIQESSTLPQWRFNAGTSVDFASRPMVIDTINGTTKIVDKYIITNVGAALGFTNWFEMGFNLPIVAYEKWTDPDNTASPAETHHGLGDLRIETKFRLLDIERYKFGIAVVPFMTIPTVTSGLQSKPSSTLAGGWTNGKFMSNEAFTGGGKLVLEGDIKNRVWLALNAGYQIIPRRDYHNPPNSDAFVDDTLLLGAGAHVRITDSWRFIAEFYSETVAKPFSNAFKSRRQSPMEFDGAVRYQPQSIPEIRGLMFTLGGGRGMISQGVGSPNYRIFAQVGFRKPKIVELPPPPPPAEVEAKVTEKIIITQKIHFEFNKANIRPISFPILDDVVELLNKNPNIKKVEVGGHCDGIGGVDYNLRLSQKRAQSVVNYLVGKGIAADRLVPKGYGKGNPIADNNTTEGRAKNRRVEFTVLE